MVKRRAFGFITFPEANQVWCDHPVSGLQPDGNHFPVQVAPCRVAVQTKVHSVRILGAFVEIVHAQTRQRVQITDKTSLPRIIGQAGESNLIRTESILPKWLCVCFVHAPAILKKRLERQCALFLQKPPMNLGLMVELADPKEVND